MRLEAPLIPCFSLLCLCFLNPRGALTSGLLTRGLSLVMVANNKVKEQEGPVSMQGSEGAKRFERQQTCPGRSQQPLCRWSCPEGYLRYNWDRQGTLAITKEQVYSCSFWGSVLPLICHDVAEPPNLQTSSLHDVIREPEFL